MNCKLNMALLVVLLLGGCGAQDESVDPKLTMSRPTSAMAARRDAAQPGQIKLPDRLRFPSVDYVKSAPSWNDRLATFTTAEKARLESLNARYYGMLEFHSAEEQRKLIEAGFPMPEEWLAAAAMSDQELKQLADAQSPKGSLFFADRELDRFLENKQRMLDNGHYNDMDKSIIDSQAQAMLYAGNALSLTRSPFAAYLYGSVFGNLFGDAEYTAAAISVARALGDPRATEYTDVFTQQLRWGKAPPLEFGTLSAIETSMWMDVHRYRPL
jgi:hypothetical protein